MTFLGSFPNPAICSGWLGLLRAHLQQSPRLTPTMCTRRSSTIQTSRSSPPTGGERRKANTIAVTDMLKLKAQMSFPRFFGTDAKGSASQ